MDRLYAMQIFKRVVDARSFRKAAESLSMPRSTVSRSIKELEAYLGVTLLQRTTRKFSLTPDGSIYYGHCTRLLADIDAVESGFPGIAGTAGGRLRVSMPLSLGRLYILPNIRTFQRRYPEVELVLTLSDTTVDLVEDGFDCVIRAGFLEDSTSLAARRIGEFEWIVCAAPSYLTEYGEPKTIDDLRDHHAVGYTLSRTGRTMNWNFSVDGHHRAVKMRQPLVVNDTDAYLACGLEGIGLIRAASYVVSPHLSSGALVRLLGQVDTLKIPLWAVFPQTSHLSPTVRAFIEWTAQVVSPVSEWAQALPDATE